MSPSTTEQPEIERPETQNHEERRDPEAGGGEDDPRGFFKKHPAAKRLVFLAVIVAVLAVG